MTFKLRKTVNQRWKKSQTRKWANRLPRPIRYQFFLGGIKCLRLTQWTTRSLRYCLKLGYIREVEVWWRDRFYRRVFLWCWTAKRLHAKRILLSFVLFFFFIEFSNIFFKILTCMISWRVEKLKKKKGVPKHEDDNTNNNHPKNHGTAAFARGNCREKDHHRPAALQQRCKEKKWGEIRSHGNPKTRK